MVLTIAVCAFILREMGISEGLTRAEGRHDLTVVVTGSPGLLHREEAVGIWARIEKTQAAAVVQVSRDELGL